MWSFITQLASVRMRTKGQSKKSPKKPVKKQLKQEPRGDGEEAARCRLLCRRGNNGTLRAGREPSGSPAGRAPPPGAHPPVVPHPAQRLPLVEAPLHLILPQRRQRRQVEAQRHAACSEPCRAVPSRAEPCQAPRPPAGHRHRPGAAPAPPGRVPSGTEAELEPAPSGTRRSSISYHFPQETPTQPPELGRFGCPTDGTAPKTKAPMQPAGT